MANETLLRWASGLLLLVIFLTSGFYRARAHRLGGRLPARPDGVVATWVRVGFGIVVWGALLVPIFAPAAARWFSLPLPAMIRWIGLGLVALAWPILWWTLASVGNNISQSTSTREGARLVTSGPYRFVRHPLYTGGYLATFGIGLALESIPLLLAVEVLTWWLPRRAAGEEKNLTASYGEAYRAYLARVPRFVPALSRAA